MLDGARGVALASALLLAVYAGPAVGGSEQNGEVVGRLRLPFEEASLGQIGPIVAYLEPIAGFSPPRGPRPATTTVIRQKNARFSPSFAVVSVGDPLEMANDDFIFHNVFSYSRPNHFDLGVYPAGESRTVVFTTPGVVKTYCSIHETMNATIFVAPTRHHALVGPDGGFAIAEVPPGRYRLRTWSEMLPSASQEIAVGSRRSTRIALTPAAQEAPAPASPAP